MAGSGWAGRAAGGRRRSHRGWCRAEGRVGGGEAGSQGADGGHGGHCCAAETGDGLRKLAGHLVEGKRDVFKLPKKLNPTFYKKYPQHRIMASF